MNTELKSWFFFCTVTKILTCFLGFLPRWSQLNSLQTFAPKILAKLVKVTCRSARERAMPGCAKHFHQGATVRWFFCWERLLIYGIRIQTWKFRMESSLPSVLRENYMNIEGMCVCLFLWTNQNHCTVSPLAASMARGPQTSRRSCSTTPWAANS